jgi:G3E family GTPase
VENSGSQLLRVKGIVKITEVPERPAVVQGVQDVFSPLDWLERWRSEDRSSRLVFIVQDVCESWVATLWDLIEAEVEDEARRAAAHVA